MGQPGPARVRDGRSVAAGGRASGRCPRDLVAGWRPPRRLDEPEAVTGLEERPRQAAVGARAPKAGLLTAVHAHEDESRAVRYRGRLRRIGDDRPALAGRRVDALDGVDGL